MEYESAEDVDMEDSDASECESESEMSEMEDLQEDAPAPQATTTVPSNLRASALSYQPIHLPHILSVLYDIWDSILHDYVDIKKDFTRKNVADLQYLCNDFCAIFRPYMYRHVNLRTPKDAITFFTTLHRRPYLAPCVLSLQFTFSLDPYGDVPAEVWRGVHPYPVPSRSDWKLFWFRFRQALPSMTNLSSLAVSFSHDDDAMLFRLIRRGRVADSLPSSLKILHLRPIPDQYYDPDKDLLDEGPWDKPAWRLHITQIPHIETLILTTPLYVVWPPSQEGLDETLAAWTAQFKHHTSSSLSKIIINFGLNEGAHIENWEAGLDEDSDEEEHDEDDDEELMPPRRVAYNLCETRFVGGSLGPQVVWVRVGKKSWKEFNIHTYSNSNRQEYLFGSEGSKWGNAWLLVDAEDVAKVWRANQDFHCRMPGLGNFYTY
ncbi:hypothetical protein DFH06DRAFT_1174620 [Mycena polygramma]|nr:hypothetical protein DFH06DRAFT_1174620 [Mycena polygramma]